MYDRLQRCVAGQARRKTSLRPVLRSGMLQWREMGYHLRETRLFGLAGRRYRRCHLDCRQGQSSERPHPQAQNGSTGGSALAGDTEACWVPSLPVTGEDPLGVVVGWNARRLSARTLRGLVITGSLSAGRPRPCRQLLLRQDRRHLQHVFGLLSTASSVTSVDPRPAQGNSVSSLTSVSVRHLRFLLQVLQWRPHHSGALRRPSALHHGDIETPAVLDDLGRPPVTAVADPPDAQI